MKKVIFGIAVAVAAVSAQASYLNWQVAATDGSNGAQLYAVSTGGGTKTAATDGTVIDAISGLPGAKSTDITSYSEGYSFYIELVNYSDTTTGTYTSQGAMSSQTFTYSELSGAMSSGALSVAGMTAVWTGTTVQATPEPTSGLLMLMGFAMLGLKRKKEV